MCVWRPCVFRDGAVSGCGLAADSLLRAAQSVEGVAGEELEAGPASAPVSVCSPAVLPQRQQLRTGQQSL